MSLPTYKACNDSGIAWLGAVPDHWKVRRLKWFIKRNDGGVWGEEPDGLNDTVVLRSTEQTVDGRWQIDDPAQRKLTEQDRLSALLEKGDLLVTKSSGSALHIGKTTLVDEEVAALCACYSNFMQRLRLSDQLSPKLAWYILNNSLARLQLDLLSNSTTGLANLNGTIIGELLLAVPPQGEQTAIVAFLDREAAKLDTLICEQQKLVALLTEKRQALIAQAVTRGIDSKAPMKHSGVTWLGEVPTHWETYFTKRLFRLVAEPAPDNNEEELLSIYTDIGVRPRKSLEERGNRATTTDGYWIVRKGDIIVNKLLAWMGAIGLSEYDGVTSPAYDILRNTKPLNPKFYDYLFRCGVMFTEFRRNSRGIMDMRLRLYFEDFGQIPIPYPSEREQSEIVEFLDSETAKLDALRAKAQHAIALLKERRSALVAAAVTGQIDVRNTVTRPTLSAEAIAA